LDNAPFGAPLSLFVAHDLGPKTGHHFSGSCAAEARHLDGLRQMVSQRPLRFSLLSKTRTLQCAARTTFLFHLSPVGRGRAEGAGEGDQTCKVSTPSPASRCRAPRPLPPGERRIFCLPPLAAGRSALRERICIFTSPRRGEVAPKARVRGIRPARWAPPHPPRSLRLLGGVSPNRTRYIEFGRIKLQKSVTSDFGWGEANFLLPQFEIVDRRNGP